MKYPKHAGDLVIQKISSRRWRTVYPFKYYVDQHHIIHIPIGFETDLASIPRLATPIVPKIGAHDKAALVHDWLYEAGWLESWQGNRIYITRRDADRVFYQAMRYFGVRRARATLMYAAVRAGGYLAWSAHGHKTTEHLFS